MAYKDTKYQSLEINLNAIGKAVFVNFYYDFKDTTIDANSLADKLLRENPKSHSQRQSFRIPRARHIFETGQELDALEIIIHSDRVDSDAREKAKIILKAEKQQILLISDNHEERIFNEELNKEIVYSERTPFEYDNTPHKPKKLLDTSRKTYPRSRSVSKHALENAEYTCEVNKEHKLFKRRNSNINYTEPHHLVPLSAAVNFPDIDLDREQNVVSLCSHCHNLLHYGADAEEVLMPLYEMRKDLLSKIGVNISYEDLVKYYS